MKFVTRRLRYYFTLIKSLQTALLLITGAAGFLSARDLTTLDDWLLLGAVCSSLFLAISGSTVFNMVYDRDIDLIMKRTCTRPLPTNALSVREVFFFALGLSFAGITWALLIQPLYGAIVFAGFFFNAVIYTVWLKRRTPFAIILGGLSGGMPVLAGRALAVGQIDLVGMLLTLAVLFWIPTHILTFSMRYFEDYQRAQLPTFPAAFGFNRTRTTIAVSSVIAGALIVAAALLVGVTVSGLQIIALLSLGLLALAFRSVWRPSDKINFRLFKYASIYMLTAMIFISL